MDRLSAALDFQNTPVGREMLNASRLREKAANNRYASNRLANPRHNTKSSLQALLKQMLKRGKDGPTLFGCSSHSLKDHFSSQFRGGMSWDNYGSLWEIDHVVPVCRFTQSEFLSAFHYTNLRPRLSHLNRLDGHTISRMRTVFKMNPYRHYDAT